VIFGYHEKKLKVLLQQSYTLDKWTVHRSPLLYKFNKEKYEEGLKSGVALAF
jgi:hypothetical protein